MKLHVNMEFHLRGRQEVEDFINNEVLSTTEVAEILNVNKQRMSALINTERITPVKRSFLFFFSLSFDCCAIHPIETT